MSIRPVEINGVISRMQDITAIKQSEENKAATDQNYFQSHLKKEAEHNQKKVRDAEDSENYQPQYDAKEKGNGQEYVSKSIKTKVKKEKQDYEPIKDRGGFDIRI